MEGTRMAIYRSLLHCGAGLLFAGTALVLGATQSSAQPAHHSPSVKGTCRVTKAKGKVHTVCRAVMTVSAQANIFGAGRTIPPAPGGGGGGTPPPVFRFPAHAGQVLRFLSVAGTVSPAASVPLAGPTGTTAWTTDIVTYGGISGIMDNSRTFFLVGVFMDQDAPGPIAPPRLDFTGAESYTPLAPQLEQTFYIGDGQDVKYQVPAGATRLYLGFADADKGQGAPGWYSDNRGQLQVAASLQH